MGSPRISVFANEASVTSGTRSSYKSVDKLYSVSTLTLSYSPPLADSPSSLVTCEVHRDVLVVLRLPPFYTGLCMSSSLIEVEPVHPFPTRT